MCDSCQPIRDAFHSLLRRFGGAIGAVPQMAYKGLQDALDGVGLDEPGWA